MAQASQITQGEIRVRNDAKVLAIRRLVSGRHGGMSSRPESWRSQCSP